MLSLQDCLALSGLTDDEVAAIAEHEHIPSIVAAELGCDLLQTPKGVYRLHCMLLETLEQAEAHGDRDHVLRLRETYSRFLATHPLPRVL